MTALRPWIKAQARAARKIEGIQIDDTTWNEIVAAGRKVGVAVA